METVLVQLTDGSAYKRLLELETLNLIKVVQNNSNSSSSNNSSSGCDCNSLQAQYNSAKKRISDYSNTYADAGTRGNVGAVAGQGGTAVDKSGNIVRESGGNEAFGDVRGGNATLRQQSGAIIRQAEQDKRRIEAQARSCGCTLR